MIHSRISGLLLGTAVGDALGLPREGLSPERARKWYGDVLEHRLIFGRGMISDDTEHTAMVAQAWLASGGDVDRFRRSLAWKLKGWLLALPAGVGMATARSIVKLWLGWPATKSGVWSAGNGPAMRSGILGLLARDDEELRALVSASTRITHTDPRAERAALLVAIACRMGPEEVQVDRYLERVRAVLPDPDKELEGILGELAASLALGENTRAFCGRIGIAGGVSGYAYHTVPVALHAWLRHPADFRAVLTETITLGGDADTVGAIAGAMSGATVGESGVPAEWIDGILDYPRSTSWIRRLGERLEENGPPLPLCWPIILPRNLAFLAIVLLHGFRRLLPPY